MAEDRILTLFEPGHHTFIHIVSQFWNIAKDNDPDFSAV